MAAYYFDQNGSTLGFGTLTKIINNANQIPGSTNSSGLAIPGVLGSGSTAHTYSFGSPTTNANTTPGTITFQGTGTFTANGIFYQNLTGNQTWTKTTGTGSLTLGGTNPFIEVTATGKLIFSVFPLQGTVNWEKRGASTLQLNAANTFSGGMTISAGTVEIGNASALGTGTVTMTGGKLSSSSTTGYVVGNPLVFNGTVTLGDSTNTGAVSTTGTATFNGGTTTVLMDGGVQGLFRGTTTINSATLVVNNYNLFGYSTNASAASVTINTGGTLTNSTNGFLTTIGPLTMAGGTLTSGAQQNVGFWAGAYILRGGVTATENSTISGFPITIGSDTSPTGTINVASGKTLTISTQLDNTPNTAFNALQTTNLTKQTGTGTLTLTGANTFTGTVSVSAGTLNANSATALGADQSTVTVSSGATLSLGVAPSPAYATRSLAMQGTGVAIASVPSGALIINNTGTNTFAGSIALAADTYVRGTASGTFSNALAPATGQKLLVGADSGKTLTLSGIVSGLGGVTAGPYSQDAAGTVTLSGANTFTGVTTLTYGTLSVSSIGNGGVASGNLGSATNAAANIVFNGGTLQYTGGVSSTDRNFTLTGDGSIDASGSGALTWSGVPTIASGAKTLTLTGTSTSTNTMSGILENSSGTLSIAKSGTGTWVLSNANTFTGTVTVTAGTLNANNATALGADTAGRALTVANAASLHINNVAVTYSNLAISIAGDGVSTLGAIYTTGSNVLNLGAITLSAAAKIRFGGAGSLAGTITNAGFALTLQAATGFFPSVISTITGAGALFVGGTANGVNQTGSVTLTSTSNNYTGTTTVSTGTFTVTGRLGLGTYAGNISIASSTTFNYNSSSSQTLSGTISGAGALQRGVSGGGVLTITGTNTYTGTTSISFSTISVPVLTTAATPQPLGTNATINVGLTNLAGTLRYTGTGDTTDKVINLAGTTGNAVIAHTGSGTLTFTSNFTATGSGAKTLAFTGTVAPIVISGVIPDSAGGATSLTYSVTSTLTLSAANTYTGLTTVSGSATVVAGNTQALGLGNVTLSTNTATLQTLTGSGPTPQNGKLTITGTLTNSAGGTIRIGA